MGGAELRIPALDLLRGLAASVVAAAHYCLFSGTAPAASEAVSIIAVEVFFALSGFVLAPQIIQIVTGKTFPGLWIFLVRRWMRTVPAYLLALAFSWVLFSRTDLADLSRYAFYVQNLTAQHNNNDYFAVAWSLAVEEWFYLVFPATLILAGVLTNRPQQAAIFFVVAVAALRFLFAPSENWDEEVRRVTLFRIDAIAYGFLLYTFSLPLKLAERPIAATISVAATGALLSYIAFLGEMKSLFPFAAAAFSVSVVWLTTTLTRLPDAVAAASIWVGRLSYSVYLFHSIVLTLLFSAMPAGLLSATIYAIATTLIAALVFQFVEKPILDARPNYSSASNIPELQLSKVG